MTVFGGFITGGTVSTDPGDATKLTFSGIVINGALGAVAGDTFSAGGYQVPIASIDGTGAATLVYAFPVALDGEADYAIVRDSAERYNPAATNLLVRQYLAKIADASITYVVPDDGDGPTDLIAPDPQEGQKAIRFSNPWKTWLYTEGAWVEQPGSPGGPGPQGEAGATWLAQDAEPTTDYPPNSLWVDTDSAGLDVYELSGSPLNWVSLGFGLKGPQGDASTVPGPQGPIGPAFEPDEVVPNLAGRDAYDDEVKNFAVLVEVDSSNSNEPTLYFKLSAASADWSAGFTFVGGGGSGDVVGPSSSTDGNIVLFDGPSGKATKDSGKAVSDFATSAQAVPAGGATGQILARDSGGGTEWVNPPSGDDPWGQQPIGVPIPVLDNIVGVAAPPTDKGYRYIKLTAFDAYNTSVLTSESVSGSDPLVVATAVISLAGSPLDGQTISLINTEGRFLRGSTSAGTLQNDAIQNHAHGSAFIKYVPSGGNTGFGAAGTAQTFSATDGAITGAGGSIRTGNETRVKNLGVTYFMRIK